MVESRTRKYSRTTKLILCKMKERRIMNARQNLIFVEGKNKTADLKKCEYNIDTKSYEIQYSDGTKEMVECKKLIWLKNPKILNPNLYRIEVDEQELYDVESIDVFEGKSGKTYWHICFSNNSEYTYLKSNLKVIESCLEEEDAKNVFEYIKQISNLSELKNEETGEKFLPKKFEKIDFVRDDIALTKYLKPNLLNIKDMGEEYIPIFPFGCNNSQYKAVKNAMEKQISIIQGPPGTGKTQTILNIIANILMQGKTVQVVSNNNSATENIYEKLSSPEYELEFITATLGRKENKENFIKEQKLTYPDFATWKTDDENIIEDIKEKSSRLKLFYDKQEEVAMLKQEQAQLLTELEYFNKYLEETNVDIANIKVRKQLTSKRWMLLWQECELVAEEKRKISLWFKIKNFFEYGVTNFKFYKQDISKVINTFQAKFYETKKTELDDAISDLESYIESENKKLSDTMCAQSMVVFKNELARRYEGNTIRKKFEEEDLWKNSYEVLKEYPVILSTTFSSTSNLNTNVIYDYLIIDEASQVDLATGALALSCAKNVVIVGDTKQLPNIVTRENKTQAQAIFNSFNIHEGYQFTKSFLQSILEVMPNVTQTLLREHYRCHPKIINFCNQKFYRGELIIMTKDNGEQDVLRAIKTVPGNHVRDNYSQRQIDVIKEEIIPKYVEDMSGTGIIAPYNNQVKELEKEFKEMDVATVHKFQGKEKDTIIISTVDDQITDFVDDPYLINVAVSRAKKKLLLVVTGNEQTKERNVTDLIEYIQYNNFEVTESKIYSVFDYLYTQYTKARRGYLKKHKKVSKYNSENLMYALLKEIFAMNEFACLDVVCHKPMNMIIKNLDLLNERECRFVMHHATHLDFVVYNRISKKPVLVIEVDGYEHHKEGTEQEKRDKMKDSILELYQIPILRFKTNGSREKEIIISKLTEIMK